TPMAHLKAPVSVIVQVLSALTEGVGINAATRLYGVSKNSIYRWQERLSGLKKRSSCSPGNVQKSDSGGRMTSNGTSALLHDSALIPQTPFSYSNRSTLPI